MVDLELQPGQREISQHAVVLRRILGAVLRAFRGSEPKVGDLTRLNARQLQDAGIDPLVAERDRVLRRPLIQR